MWEYKVIKGEDSEIQKTLNQWKNLYDLQIEFMVYTQSDLLCVLLKRKRFNDDIPRH
jgi:hypothetical protein